MSIKIKELPIIERPYEKLEMYGAEKLTNSELLAIIIKTGTKEETSIQLAQRILKMNEGTNKNDLTFLQDINKSELLKIKGIGKVKAIQISAVIELAKRINSPVSSKKIKIKNTADVAKLLMNDLKNEKREKIKLILLNTKNIVLKIKNISYGGSSSAQIEIKDILYEAIKVQAPKIILVHNHPSGDSTPSKADYNITDRLYESAELMGIKLLDHVVIGKDNYESVFYRKEEKNEIKF